MDTNAITSKMNEFMFRLTKQLGTWLSNKLPRLSDDWWRDLVLLNLSIVQREIVDQNQTHDISGLDLAALLRIFDRNWFVITDVYFVNGRVRSDVRTMQKVRNRWAHISPDDITKETVMADVNVIIDLMHAFDATMSNTHDMESFLYAIESGAELPAAANKVETSPAQEEIKDKPSAEIDIGSVVVLVSDPTVIGAVIGVSGNKYSVLVNGEVRSYYAEQIRLKDAVVRKSFAPLSKVRSALTAYQINNPGANNLYSLNSARIDFVPYQFRPALKMIHADSPRILVSDDVGVGKTIEAGLILKELEARSSASSVLVICPRPLVVEGKWKEEMKRFDENFTQLDGKELLECFSETDRDGEWPERHSKTIIPYSLFSEDVVMGRQSTSRKKRKELGLSELDPLPHFDLVIVDEAHTIRNPNTWAYQGVELFCRNADAVIFLTATPLQNSDNDLYTLLNLLRPDVVIDKDTFRTMSEPNRYINNLLRIVRKMDDGWQEAGKEQISYIINTTWGRSVIQHDPNFEKVVDFLDKETATRDERMEAISQIEALHTFHTMINRTRRKDIEDFCIRRTSTVDAPFNDEQRALYDSLIEFESSALAMLHGSRSVRFMMCTIMRQAASCIHGLAPFMKDFVHRRMAQILQDGELYEKDFDLSMIEEGMLRQLAEDIEIRSRSLPDNDPKFEKLLEVIDQKQTEENNRVIIFSSFRHTLSYLREKLTRAGIRVGQVDGSVPDEERYAMRKRFLLDRSDPHAIDVLLFSEIGCEGLDYQFCDSMINYDLPWNPMRIEQRIGRIDRRGQKSESVKIYNLITSGTIDAVIYDRCLSKIGVFEDSIGDCAEILGDISDQIIKIMFDPELTAEERQLKIEQMADNEIGKVQELHRLEQEEKSLFGFDLTQYMIDRDVQDAENSWISPDSMQELLNIFMEDYLGPGEYLRGKQEAKTLRLSAEKRQMLLSNLGTLSNISVNNASKLWRAYLKSNNAVLPVTFDSTCAKEDRNIAFLTQMHPFVIQAAAYESRLFPCEVSVAISDDDIKPGDYEFVIYAWRYVGLRPDIRLVTICNNPEIEKNLLSYLQVAADFEPTGEDHEQTWSSMDDEHYQRWQTAREAYSENVRGECNFRQDRLTHSYHQQETIIRNIMDSVEDERILRMRASQLDNIKKRFDQQMADIEQTMSKVDIHTDLLVKGVIHIG